MLFSGFRFKSMIFTQLFENKSEIKTVTAQITSSKFGTKRIFYEPPRPAVVASLKMVTPGAELRGVTLDNA